MAREIVSFPARRPNVSNGLPRSAVTDVRSADWAPSLEPEDVGAVLLSGRVVLDVFRDVLLVKAEEPVGKGNQEGEKYEEPPAANDDARHRGTQQGES